MAFALQAHRVPRILHGLLSLLALLAGSLLAQPVAGTAQLVNGQDFTFGLSIIDAPFPDSPYTAGSQLPIAIEVSGDGRIPLDGTWPGSDQPTRFDLLEIFLVSAETGMNYTVSTGPGLLQYESGSVRHLTWEIPTCVSAGDYNLTFYESSHLNDTAYFIVTPIGVTINEADKASDVDDAHCNNITNDLQPQPQDDSPLPQIPFLPDDPMPFETKPVESSRTQPTPTIYTITIQETGVTLTFPTVTETPMPVTVAVVQETTITTTENGQPVTTTVTTMYTTTGMAGDGGDLDGFFPINNARIGAPAWTAWGTSVCAAVFVGVLAAL